MFPKRIQNSFTTARTITKKESLKWSAPALKDPAMKRAKKFHNQKDQTEINHIRADKWWIMQDRDNTLFLI